ncbi:hypothetical protein SUDANB180_03354 [Streptomyces sp. enrichment culture]
MFPLPGQTGVDMGGPEHDAGDKEEQHEPEAGERTDRCGPGYDGRGQQRTVDRTRVVGPRLIRTVLCGAAARGGDAGHTSMIAGTTAQRTTKTTGRVPGPPRARGFPRLSVDKEVHLSPPDRKGGLFVALGTLPA